MIVVERPRIRDATDKVELRVIGKIGEVDTIAQIARHGHGDIIPQLTGDERQDIPDEPTECIVIRCVKLVNRAKKQQTLAAFECVRRNIDVPEMAQNTRLCDPLAVQNSAFSLADADYMVLGPYMTKFRGENRRRCPGACCLTRSLARSRTDAIASVWSNFDWSRLPLGGPHIFDRLPHQSQVVGPAYPDNVKAPRVFINIGLQPVDRLAMQNLQRCRESGSTIDRMDKPVALIGKTVTA